MEEFKLLSYGWAKGHVIYGGGLMIESVACARASPPNTEGARPHAADPARLAPHA